MKQSAADLIPIDINKIHQIDQTGYFWDHI